MNIERSANTYVVEIELPGEFPDLELAHRYASLSSARRAARRVLKRAVPGTRTVIVGRGFDGSIFLTEVVER